MHRFDFRAPTRARFRLWALTAVAAALAALVAAAPGLGVVSHAHGDDVDAYDSRTASLAPTAAQEAAAKTLGAEVHWNRFGTPSSIAKLGGFLATGVQGGSAAEAARAWAADNLTLLRLGSAADLEVASAAPLAGTDDAHAVVFRQVVDGVTTSDNVLTVGLVGSASAGWKVAYVGSTLTAADAVTGTLELTQAEAFAEAADDVGDTVSPADVQAVGSRQGWTTLKVTGLDERQLVRAVAFGTPKRGAVRAYETIYAEGADVGFRHVVDAETGAVLLRQSIVDHAAENPTWKVFPAYPQLTPMNHFPWNYPSADTRDLWCWFPAPGCKEAVANQASPHEWDKNARTNTPTFTTRGNNNHAFEAWYTDGGEVTGTRYQPTSPTRDYVYPWTNQWFEERCNPAVFETPQRNDIDAATVNLFAMHNRMHDWTYNLGFTPERWNAQDFNYGRPFLENDPLEGRVQSGAIVPKSRDNANMSTRPDGTSSRTNMFLWQPIAGGFYAPCVDGDYDQSVIGHEFAHMVENRMIGKGVRRQGFHAGAMGESVSDLIGMEYLAEYDYVPVAGESPYAVGAYVTGNGFRGIRNYNMSWRQAGEFPREADTAHLTPAAWTPRGGQVNPLNFSDVGYDLVGPQVHADGEIWSATNFDIRELLLDRYPYGGHDLQRECAEGQRPAQDCPGNRRWMQLYYDAMVLMPIAPTFLDARNAVLAADVMRFGGANQDLLWLAYARRGFGEKATNVGPEDREPRGSWESPLHEEATLTFNAVAKDEAGQPVDAQVYVGHYEARVTPVERVSRFVPNGSEGYDFVAKAAGYGHVRFHVDGLKPGEARTITIHMPTNWASTSKGATAAGDGVNHDRLIDDTEGTNWQATGAPAQGRQVVVQLAGPRTFDLVKASALLVPGQNRFTALRQFELYACTAGNRLNPTCAATTDAGWQRILRTHKDAFPGVNPRPTAPDMVLRAFEVPRTTATHVRLVVLENQCTGNPHFQGEQDDDPTNPTDCRDTTVDEQIRASELQLQSSRPRVDGAQLAE